jgi:hypothetical protein
MHYEHSSDLDTVNRWQSLLLILPTARPTLKTLGHIRVKCKFRYICPYLEIVHIGMLSVCSQIDYVKSWMGVVNS